MSVRRIGVGRADGFTRISGQAKFDATAYSDLLVWYAPTEADASDGSSVSTIVDYSGNSLDMTTSGTVTYGRDTFATGVHSIDFATSSAASSGAFQHTDQWSVYAVVQRPTATGNAGLVDADGLYTPRQAQYLRYYGTLGESIMFSSTGSAAVASGPVDQSNVNVMSALLSATTVYVYCNGVLVDSSPDASGAHATHNRTLDLNTASGTWKAETSYGDVALYGVAHGDATHTAIVDKLMEQYGVA